VTTITATGGILAARWSRTPGFTHKSCSASVQQPARVITVKYPKASPPSPGEVHLRFAPTNAVLINAALLLLLMPLLARAQDRSGELRLSVTDSDGAVLSAHGLLVSQASHFELAFDTAPTGEYIAKKLPLGTYHLTIEHAGFAPYNSLVEIHSQLPQKIYPTPKATSVLTADVMCRRR